MVEREAVLVELSRKPLERDRLLTRVRRQLLRPPGGSSVGTPGALDRVEQENQADTGARDADDWK